MRSGKINLTSIGENVFYLIRKDHSEIRYFKLIISQYDATLFITFEEQADNDVSYQIINNIQTFIISVYQKTHNQFSFSVKPRSQIPFAWTEPTDNNNEIEFRLFDGRYYTNPINLDINNLKEKIHHELCFANGSRIWVDSIITIKNKSRIIKFSNHKMSNQLSISNKILKISFEITFFITGIGISLISKLQNRRTELLYIYLKKIQVAWKETKYFRSVQFRIKDIIIDNNIKYDCKYPVILYHDHNNKENGPSFDFLINQRKLKNANNIIYFYDIVLYLGEFSISLDSNTLNKIIDLIQYIQFSTDNLSIKTHVHMQQFIFLPQIQKKVKYLFLIFMN